MTNVSKTSPVTRFGTISAAVLAIIGSVFVLEGGYVNDKNDPGGATKYGVTEKVAREHGYTGSMQNLPKDTALVIYAKSYAEKPGFSLIVNHAEPIGEKLITTGVNVGTHQVSLWFQRSINMYSRNGRDYPLIAEDGKIGPATLNAYKALERKRGRVNACLVVLKSLDGFQLNHYYSISKRNSNLMSFNYGWVTNRVGDVPLSKCKELK